MNIVFDSAYSNDGDVIFSSAISSNDADIIAPNLTNASAVSTGETTATGSVTTDEANGTLYYYISENATETLATIKASGSTQTVSSTGQQSVSFTGLTAGVSYYVHYLHTDAAANDSDIAVSNQITTDVGPQVPQGTVTVGNVTKDDTSATIPFTYDLADQTGFEYSLDGGAWTATTSPISLTGLTALTSYTVAIAAVNAEGRADPTIYSFITNIDPSIIAAFPPGTMSNLRVFAAAGFTKGSYNERAINYYKSLGATSNQYNLAQQQAEEQQ